MWPQKNNSAQGSSYDESARLRTSTKSCLINAIPITDYDNPQYLSGVIPGNHQLGFFDAAQLLR